MLLSRLRQFRWQQSLVRKLIRRSGALGVPPGRVRVSERRWLAPLRQVRIAREDDGFRVFLDVDRLSDRTLRWVPESRVPALLMLFSRTDPALVAIDADISDGEEGGPGIVGFCSVRDDAILVPDPMFLKSNGYARFRESGFDPTKSWWKRSDTVLWRGTTTGDGLISNETMQTCDETLIQRVRMCLALRGVPGVDAKIASIAQSAEPAIDGERLAAAGILDRHMDAMVWLGCRYALDVDGNSNAWSNLFTRLLLGNCVIKVASPRGYRQWYYDRLRPGVHYVGVRADMSDLVEKIEWCLANPAACLEIASAGRALALSMTVESETAAAVARLDAIGPAAG